MKQKFIFTFLFFLSLCLSLFGQNSSGFHINNQGVLKDANGNPIANENINLVVDWRIENASVYTEECKTTTNLIGEYQVVMGQCDPVSGNPEDVDFTQSLQYQLEVQIRNGAFANLGTYDYLPEAYAVESGKARNMGLQDLQDVYVDDGSGLGEDDIDQFLNSESQNFLLRGNMSVVTNTVGYYDTEPNISFIPTSKVFTGSHNEGEARFLGANGIPNVGFTSGDTSGNNGVIFVAGPESPSGQIFTSSEGNGNFLLTGKDFIPHVFLGGQNGRGSTQVFDNGTLTHTFTFDGSGNPSFGVGRSGNTFQILGGTNSDGGPVVQTVGPNGKNQILLTTFPGANGLPYIPLLNENGEVKAGMYIDPNTGYGTIFGDMKNFKTDHPRDAGKEIWYASMEGPEAGMYSRGTAKLVNGKVTIPYPEHFSLLVNAQTATVMLTPMSIESKGLAVTEKTATGFTVQEIGGGTGNYQFDWEVKAVRKGFEDFQVIRNKADYIPPKGPDVPTHSPLPKGMVTPAKLKLESLQNGSNNDKS